MIGVDATVNVDDVLDGLDGLHKVRLRDAFRALKTDLREDLKDHRKQQAGPSGKWAARKVIPGRKRIRRKLLGKLPSANTIRADAARLVGVSKVKWSEAQNAGGRVGRNATLPARPYMWMSEKFIARAREVFSQLLEYGWVKKRLPNRKAG